NFQEVEGLFLTTGAGGFLFVRPVRPDHLRCSPGYQGWSVRIYGSPTSARAHTAVAAPRATTAAVRRKRVMTKSSRGVSLLPRITSPRSPHSRNRRCNL